MPLLDKNPFKQPSHSDIKIWRYMSLEKFLNLLAQGLYLCRAYLLEDKFEGALTEATYNATKTRMDSTTPPIDYEQHRKDHYINSWYAGNNESYLMWKYYGAQDGAIAIQSTYEKLQNSTNEDFRTFFMGSVEYVDENEQMQLRVLCLDGRKREHLAAPFFYKKKPFEAEQEIRLVKYSPTHREGIIHPKYGRITFSEDHIPKGIHIKANFNHLIEKIWISPWALKGTADTLRDILENYYKISKPIEVSYLAQAPRF